MICAIYKSNKKLGAYLYIKTRDDFSQIPKELLTLFGRPHFSMLLNLSKKDKLANADINQVRKALQENGYYLQLPPLPEQILAKIKTQNTKMMMQK